jgi:hypothetical protein
MQNLAVPLIVASVSAISIKDPKFDGFYANVDRDHYVESGELDDFVHNAE